MVAGDSVEARLDLSRTAAGYAVRMRFTAHVSGPCMRCLEGADVAVEVDAREVDHPGTYDEELRSPYIEGDELDLAPGPTTPWRSRFPSSLFAGPTAGACARSAAFRSTTPIRTSTVTTPPPDPRWDKLRELGRG